MEQAIINLVSGYLAMMNLLGFAVMGIDKRKAIKRAYRIPERTLFLVAFLGGGIGTLVSMYVFRHKTKHTRFIILMPIAAGLNIIILFRLWGII